MLDNEADGNKTVSVSDCRTFSVLSLWHSSLSAFLSSEIHFLQYMSMDFRSSLHHANFLKLASLLELDD